MIHQAGFPKQMHHPQHAPSVMTKDALGNISGTPVRLPPEQADTADTEAELRARGYIEAGEASNTMIEYHEYPLMMSHPDHVPAVPDQITATAENGVFQTHVIPGKPEVLPDAFVNNTNEERAWELKGYTRAGLADAKAYDRSVTAPGMPGAQWPKWVEGVLMEDPDKPAPPTNEYPKWITLPSQEKIIVNSRAEECNMRGLPLTIDIEVGAANSGNPNLALKSSDAPNAPEMTPELWAEFQAFQAWKAENGGGTANVSSEAGFAPAAPTPMTLTHTQLLRREAAALGIAYDKRWGETRLRAAIEAHKAGIAA